ncbi:MAG: aspartate-semialdehyde dehydrogenase [archaeon]|nr:aspartate-semialdehyde dehydrogenase [archaeon]
MVNQKKAAVIGATGMAGQQFLEALDNHPWIKIVSLHGSSTIGKTFREARKGFSNSQISEEILEMKIKDNKEIDLIDVDIVFSAVPSSIAINLENELAVSKPVISTASAFRYEDDVPIFLPIINANHIEMLNHQKKKRGWKGYIIPGPNCTAVGLAISIYPIFKKFGLKSVHVVSMQAISGAGYPGVASYDVNANIIPHISEEEEKVKKEVRKMLGYWNSDEKELNCPDFLMDAKCNRVPVLNGHTESVFIETVKETTKEDIISSWKDFKSECSDVELELPNAPKQPIIYFTDPYRPQPRVDLPGNGMATLIGGLKETEFSNGFKFVCISHNTQLGAGRGGVLSAEYLIAKKFI